MKKIKNLIKTTLLVFFSSAMYAQTAPGGVAPGLQLWMRSDKGVTGSPVTAWKDQSSNGLNTSVTGSPTVTANGLNFNPTINFTSSNYFTIASNTKHDPSVNGITTFGVAYSSNSYPILTKTDNSSWDNGWVLVDNYGSSSTQYGFVWGNSSGDGSGNTALQNKIVGQANIATGFWNTTTKSNISVNGVTPTSFNGSTTSSIGNTLGIGQSPGYQYTGVIPEVIIYNVDIGPANRAKVESYLAIKYGVTLNAGGTSYVNSDGGTIWATNATYKNNVAGIGRDDASDLNQKQSGSINIVSPQIACSLGTIAANNQANTNTFAADKNFLTWADNGLSGTQIKVQDGYNSISNRIWKVTPTGSFNQDVVIYVPASLSAFTTNRSIVINASDATFPIGSTQVQLSTTITTVNGVSCYSATIPATLASTNFYMTFAGSTVAPGGQNNAIQLWVRGDKGLTGTSNITAWKDQSPNGFDTSKTGTPQFVSYINFNPAVTFGAGNYFSIAHNNLLNQDANNKITVAAVSKASNTTYNGFLAKTQNSGWDSGWVLAADGGGTEIGFTTDNWNGGHPSNVAYSSYIADVPSVSFAYSTGTATNNLGIAVNGQSVANASGAYTTTTQPLTIGNAGGYDFTGQVAEAIMYNTDNSTSKIAIESYLATKYGITLNDGNYTYKNSQGITTWVANTTYKYNIAGIGRDDTSDLYQKQSQSQNIAMPQLAYSVGDLLISNQSNTGMIANDKQYFMWADNGLAGTTTFTQNNMSLRSTRVWKHNPSSGFSHNLKVYIPINLVGFNAYLNIIINPTDDNFASGNTFIPVTSQQTINGSNYYVADIPASIVSNAYYMTFGGYSAFPGGESNGLQLWMRADRDIAVSGNNVTAWSDHSQNKFSTTVSGTPTQAITNLINFNPSITFGSGNYFSIAHNTLLNQNASNQLTVITVNKAANSTYNAFFTKTVNSGWDDGWQMAADGNGTQLGFNTGDWSGSAPSYAAFQPFTANFPSIAFGYNSGTRNSIAVNGANTNAASSVSNTQLSTSPLQIGTAAGYTYIGDVAEAIMYNQDDSVSKARIESYLAIKYGITLNNGNYTYVDTSNSPTWAADATFKNNIAGIGRDDLTDLNQKQSQSQNNATVNQLTIGLGTITTTNALNTNTFSTNKQFLIWADNGGVQTFTGTAITASDGYVFSTPVVRKWKIKDTNGVSCVDVKFDMTNVSALTSGEKYYMIMANDAAFTTNVIYKEVTKVGNAVDVSVNFANNAATYFTLAKAAMGITPATTASGKQVGISTIGSIPSKSDTYLELMSKNLGLVITRVAGESSILNPVKGMVIYDKSTGLFKVYNGLNWRPVSTAIGSSIFCN
ncbi:beta strand repeat-containing protein [Chryseobacterium sp. SL1]|uniref:beta strand repeat-containing protein n=1 Tax=Chryseobacterium sp. SL1 TaxID=2995159 RepID=UPI002272F5AA|nr:hypothetical protein [Chryseobacterium sp. SL1]MCY1660195.1 hypothetical protein [Chryseobacterium sp. SL1]